MRSTRLAAMFVVTLLALCPLAAAQVDPEPAPEPAVEPAAEEAAAEPAPSTKPVTLSVGPGLGMPYGTVGGNFEALFNGYFAVTAGLGYTFLAGPGWAVGAHGYFLGPHKRFRPRLTVIFGTAFITDDWGGEQKAGLSLGAGGRIAFGSGKWHGLDADILVTVHPSTSSVEDDWGGDAAGIPVKLSVGYFFRF